MAIKENSLKLKNKRKSCDFITPYGMFLEGWNTMQKQQQLCVSM